MFFIQLAYRFIVYLESVLKDVLIQVAGLVFPIDFYVIVMEEDKTNINFYISLDRSFLSMARIKIDVDDGTLTMEFDEEVIKFNVYDSIKYPNDLSFVCGVDAIDTLS